MNYTTQKGNIVIWLIFLLIVVGYVAIFWVIRSVDQEKEPGETVAPSVNTYTNDEYGFSVEYPSGWSAAEDYDDTVPMLTIYKEGEITINSPPFNHFENATHVSFYPKGIPTEGLIAPNEPAQIQTSEEVTEGVSYLLENGQAWLSFIRFNNFPISWDDAGFAWMSLQVNNLEIECRRGDEILEQAECDPLGDESIEIIYKGSINEDDRQIEEEIIKSFKFREEKISDLIRVDSPKSDDAISSPLTVKGKARGVWFFEASFPINIVNENGDVIAQKFAMTAEEWMTTKFVSFEGTIEFPDQPSGSRGKVIFMKDNPSGLPEHGQSFEIPIIFQ